MTVLVSSLTAETSRVVSVEALGVRFRGRARDYFGIWATNLVLTLLTLGLWSAWAKVRRLRFFYGNTEIAGGTLDYTARGFSLLMGRIVVLAILIGVGVMESTLPFAGVVGGLVSLAVVPWLVNRSLRFNARMTLWRTVRFDFRGHFWEAARVHVGWPLLVILTLGATAPLATRAAGRYWIAHHALGRACFRSDPPVAPFYGALAQAVVVFIGVAAATAGVVWGIFSLIEGTEVSAETWVAAGWFAVLVPSFLLARVVYRTQARAILLNALELEGGHRFCSTLSGLRQGWIVGSNTVLLLATLGLSYPWGAVRAWRYQCATLTVIPGGAVDTFVDVETAAGSPFASEFTDLDGFDVSL